MSFNVKVLEIWFSNAKFRVYRYEEDDKVAVDGCMVEEGNLSEGKNIT